MHAAIQYASQYGHFHNPDYPQLAELRDADEQLLSRITSEDSLCRDAVASIQGFDGNMDVLSDIHHGRRAQFDGDIGPATRGLLDLARCSVPDFTDPGEATGSGGWPVGCDPSHKDVHSIRIAVNSTGAGSSWRHNLKDILQSAEIISASIGLSVRHIVDEGATDVEETITFGVIPGNVIGWNYLPTANTCRQVLKGKIDSGYTPDIDMQKLLWIHESHGHGVGLEHTPGGIMNPSIMRVPRDWKNDPSYARLRRLYGGDPINPGPVEPSGYSIKGLITLEKDGQTTNDRWAITRIW